MRENFKKDNLHLPDTGGVEDEDKVFEVADLGVTEDEALPDNRN